MDDQNTVSAENANLVFLSNFVHQIVNPLNGIAGTIDNLYEGDIYSKDMEKQKLNAVRAQLEQCISLIRNLAFFSEISLSNKEQSENRGLKSPNFAGKTTLPQTIIEAMQFFQVLGDERKINFALTDRNTQYLISARPELIKQVFINLFDNWIKYGRQSQTIDISPRVNANKVLIVEISGNSIGFSADEAEQLFELGYRGKSAKDKLAQGSGLGLHICRLIMKSIGGDITASHSNKNEKTTFLLYIPERVWSINVK